MGPFAVMDEAYIVLTNSKTAREETPILLVEKSKFALLSDQPLGIIVVICFGQLWEVDKESAKWQCMPSSKTMPCGEIAVDVSTNAGYRVALTD